MKRWWIWGVLITVLLCGAFAVRWSSTHDTYGVSGFFFSFDADLAGDR